MFAPRGGRFAAQIVSSQEVEELTRDIVRHLQTKGASYQSKLCSELLIPAKMVDQILEKLRSEGLAEPVEVSGRENIPDNCKLWRLSPNAS